MRKWRVVYRLGRYRLAEIVVTAVTEAEAKRTANDSVDPEVYCDSTLITAEPVE